MNALSIVMCTKRREPKFDWFADGLARSFNEYPHIPFEVIVVDGCLWPTLDTNDGTRYRRESLESAVRGRFSYRHVEPKPNPWQGPYKKTQADKYALCNARNTGIAFARGSHFVLVDDCTVVGERWLYWHWEAARRSIVACGSFTSYNTAVVKNGVVESNDLHPSGTDSRGTAMRKGYGAWCWGLNVSYPVEALLNINGFDEKYDGAGGSEDCDLGVRLERYGIPIIYFPDCMIYQILETHELVCETSSWGNAPVRKQKELMLRDGKMHYASEMLIQDLHDDPIRTWTRGNEFNLRELRAKALAEGYGAFPTAFALGVDWRDGQRLEEMN